jgi:hypothetical protein
MIAGAAAGSGSAILDSITGAGALERRKDLAAKQYMFDRMYSDQQYALSRGEAFNQAAVQQGRLNQGASQAADQFSLGLLSQAYGIQDAQIRAASDAGASLAAEGISGTRGNSSGALMRAYEQARLDRNTGLQWRDNNLALSAMSAQANNAAADIRREKDSWDYGGYRFAQKQARDSYNFGNYLLGREAADLEAPSPLNTALSIFSGGLTGAQTGLSLYSGYKEAKKYSDNPDPWADLKKQKVTEYSFWGN